MKKKQKNLISRFIFTFVLTLCIVLLSQGTILANYTIQPGFDLFTTLSSGTSYMGHAFKGVPLGTFDFGGTTGVQNTYNSDMIIQRLDEASVSGPGLSAIIDIQIVALSLVSVEPINLGFGLGYHYITLQNGIASTGQMDILFNDEDGGEVVDSFFDVFFDIHMTTPTGVVVASDSGRFTTPGDVPWTHTPPPDKVVPPGGSDYWPNPESGCIPYEAPTVPATISIKPATVPAPSAVILSILGIGMVGLFRRRKMA